jgi:hypothetical protein
MGQVWVMGKQSQNVVYNTDSLEKLQVENTNEIDYCTILLQQSMLPGQDPIMGMTVSHIRHNKFSWK